MTRSERFEIDLAATRDEVWERLTTAEGLASWFGTHAQIDLRVGRRRIVGWGDSVVGDIGRGWSLFLASLRHGLEQATHPTRTAECTYLPAPIERRLIWDRVSRAVADSAATAGLTAVLETAPHSLLLAAPDRTLLLDAEGAGDAQVLYVQAATTGDGNDLAAWRAQAIELAASITLNG